MIFKKKFSSKKYLNEVKIILFWQKIQTRQLGFHPLIYLIQFDLHLQLG